jgi:hypothetical protein
VLEVDVTDNALGLPCAVLAKAVRLPPSLLHVREAWQQPPAESVLAAGSVADLVAGQMIAFA